MPLYPVHQRVIKDANALPYLQGVAQLQPHTNGRRIVAREKPLQRDEHI